MFKKINRGTKIVVFIYFVIFGFLVYKNYDCKTFFDANLIQLITLLSAGILSVVFVQRHADVRRKIDCFEKLLYKTIENLNDETLFSNEKLALKKQEFVANRLKYMIDHSFKPIHKDLEYIKEKFDGMRTLYGENFDKDSFNAIKNELERDKVAICSKCEKIIVELYEL